MKKIKIEQRIENAVNVFFDDSKFEEKSLAYASDANLLRQTQVSESAEKADRFLKIIKQIFLFFPGTILLFNLTLFATAIALNPSIAYLNFPGRLIVALLITAFMTLFGLGNIRNPKHMIIPASVVFLAIFSGTLFASVGGGFRFMENYAMYLLPVALVIPVLAKNWIDKSDEVSSGVGRLLKICLA